MKNVCSDRLVKPTQGFSIESFYELGGSVIQLDEVDVKELEMVYGYAIEWESDPDGVFRAVPKGVRPTEDELLRAKGEGCSDAGMRSNYLNDITLENTSPVLKEKIRRLLKDRYFESFTRAFDLEVPFVDLWDGSEGISWHWDGIEATHFLVLVYITDHQVWESQFGGELKIGRHLANVSHQSNPRDEDVEELGVIQPSNGTMVVVNNHNPYLLHSCNKLSPDAGKRITLTFGVKLHKKRVMNADANVFFGNEEAGV